jgi:hypothetical protein
LYPATEVDVLAFQDRSIVCWIVPPVPLAVSEAKVEPLLIKEILPEAAPVTVGAKVTVKGTLWPAAIVTGNGNPLKVNSELLELAEERVTLAPLAVMLPVWLWLLPMVRVPKLIDAGVTPSVLVEVIAVPERETATEGLDPFELMVRVAPSVPATVGENFTDKFALLPAATV